ncbi:Efflux pump FUBT-like protein [Elsinoe fawcettii]|nr:Efflux pump FUBT-like protein [Elsinoe fawcettii]
MADPLHLDTRSCHASVFRHFDQRHLTPEMLNHGYSGDGIADVPHLIVFLENDDQDPIQFTKLKKWTITILLAVATLAVAFASTAYSSGIDSIRQDFQVSGEVALLGLSLFLLGLAVGPIIWALLSEEYGRQYIFIGTYGLFVVFTACAAASQSVEALIALRFFSAFFGAAPYTNASAAVADMFTASERGFAITVFSAAPFLGPALGPIAGTFLGAAAGWRWIQGLMAIFTGVLFIACSLYIPETYAPFLLRRRAEALSKSTGKHYISSLEAGRPKQPLSQKLLRALARPWVLLVREPIVLLMTIYLSVIYGTLYLFFAAFPIVYQAARGWSLGISGLAFLGTAVGTVVAILYVALYDDARYLRVSVAHKGVAPPESRLPPAMLGAILTTAGLFWFAWTNGPEIHWTVSITASGFFGTGMVLVFIGVSNYLIDSYVLHAASVLAANTVVRSIFGAAFPLFTGQMYSDLGIHWASSVPAFLALACLPFPFVLYKYGATIRAKCKFAAEAAAMLAQLRAASAQAQAAKESK